MLAQHLIFHKRESRMNNKGIRTQMSSTIIRAVLLNAKKSMKALMYWSILQIRSQNIGRRVL